MKRAYRPDPVPEFTNRDMVRGSSSAARGLASWWGDAALVFYRAGDDAGAAAAATNAAHFGNVELRTSAEVEAMPIVERMRA